MPYTFKLAQRVARFRTGKLLTATLLCVACNAGDDPVGPGSLDPTVPAPPPPPPPPPPSPPPAGNLPTPLRTVNVATTAQLQAALGSALPGDRIVMAAGSYSGNSLSAITRSGTAANPIVLTGPRTATITGTGVSLHASYWWLSGFRITNATNHALESIGGNYNIFEYLELDHTGSHGIAIKSGPPGSHSTVVVTGNIIRYNSIHDTGLGNPTWGEGIYLGDGYGDQRVLATHIHHNTVGPNVGSDGIEAKVSADGSVIEFNTVKTYIMIRSKNNVVNDNTVSGTSPSGGLINNASDVPGVQASNNIYHRNTATYSGSGKMFFVYDSPGTVVYCNNVAAAPTVLGVTCTQ